MPAKLAKTKVIDSFKKFNIECKHEDENTLVFLNSDPDKDMYAYFGLILNEIYDDKELMSFISAIKAFENPNIDVFTDVIKEFKECDDEYGG